jgi:hypothetical protein
MINEVILEGIVIKTRTFADNLFFFAWHPTVMSTNRTSR